MKSKRDAKRGKKRSNKKSRVVNGHAPEVASRAEVQDEIVPATAPSAQVMELSEESSNKVPPQEAADGAPTEEVVIVSSSEDMAEVEFPSELAESEQSVEEA